MDVFPTKGSEVDPSSYTVCETMKVNATAGKVVTINCLLSTQQFRYVIIQSLDSSPERLCIAEVAVYCTSQYTVTIIIVQQYNCTPSSLCITYLSQLDVSMHNIIPKHFFVQTHFYSRKYVVCYSICIPTKFAYFTPFQIRLLIQLCNSGPQLCTWNDNNSSP